MVENTSRDKTNKFKCDSVAKRDLTCKIAEAGVIAEAVTAEFLTMFHEILLKKLSTGIKV